MFKNITVSELTVLMLLSLLYRMNLWTSNLNRSPRIGSDVLVGQQIKPESEVLGMQF